jgi:hypothetical protein
MRLFGVVESELETGLTIAGKVIKGTGYNDLRHSFAYNTFN